MRKLSKRELVLIYIAAILMITYVGGILLVMPAVEQERNSIRELRKLQLEQERVKLELAGLESLEEICGAGQEAFLKSQADYGPVSANTSLEQSVLRCLEQAGLTAVSTSIMTDAVRRDPGEAKLSVQSGSIKAEAAGSKEGCIRILDHLGENPVWKLTGYTAYPEDGRDEEMVIRLELEYEMPGTTGALYELVEEEG